MSTPKIDLSPVDGTPTPSIVPTFIGHCPGSPCAVCGRIDLPAGTIAPPNTRPLCGMHFAEWRASTIIIRNVSPGAVFAEIAQAGPSEPVRDIREAMHPAGEALWTPGAPVEQVETRDVRRGFIPIADVPPDVLADIDCPESPAGAHVHVDTPHVATLPDGTRVNLPAGTVLREGEDTPPVDACVRVTWAETETPGLRPSTIEQARDLLQRARIRLVDEHDAKKLDAEIVAFLAGSPADVTAKGSLAAIVRAFVAWNRVGGPDGHDEAMSVLFALADVLIARGALNRNGDPIAESEGKPPPEHPLFALVRSFVGKPGDRGPVWSALMRLRERLDESGDLAAIDLGDELVNALNERLGQMHDALGRDTTEERTL